MNIAIVSRYCSKPSWQGSAKHVQSFAKELLEHGHKVIVISGEDVDQYLVIEQDGYQVHQIPLPKTNDILDKFVAPTKYYENFYSLGLRIFDDFGPNIVHVGAVGKMLSFVEAANFKRVPITAMMHDFFWVSLSKFFIDFDQLYKNVLIHDKKQYFNQSTFKRKIFSFLVSDNTLIKQFLPRTLINKFDYNTKIAYSVNRLYSIRDIVTEFIVQNYDNKLQLEKCGVKQKVNFVAQALVEKKLVKYKKENTNDSVLHIGYVGRISKEKGLHILFNALEAIEDKSSYKLHIISNGVNTHILEMVIGKSVNEDNIVLYSNLSGDEEIPKAIAQFDVFVCPSICSETGPRTVIESLAQKVPCIVSDTTGNRYLIKDGVNGKIFKMNDSKELSEILNMVCNDKKILKEWKSNLPRINSEKERSKEMIELHKEILNNYSKS